MPHNRKSGARRLPASGPLADSNCTKKCSNTGAASQEPADPELPEELQRLEVPDCPCPLLCSRPRCRRDFPCKEHLGAPPRLCPHLASFIRTMAPEVAAGRFPSLHMFSVMLRDAGLPMDEPAPPLFPAAADRDGMVEAMARRHAEGLGLRHPQDAAQRIGSRRDDLDELALEVRNRRNGSSRFDGDHFRKSTRREAHDVHASDDRA